MARAVFGKPVPELPWPVRSICRKGESRPAIGVAGNIEVGTMRQLITSGSSFENDIGYSRAVVDCEWVFVSGPPGLTTPP